MNPTLLDMYSRETFRDIGAVCRTYSKFEYSPIVFVYENAFQTVCTVDGDFIQTPLMAAYMLKLLQKATEKTEEIYPNFLSHIWRTGNGYFKKLVFTCEDFCAAKLLLWHNLQELADSGEVTVCETVVKDSYKDFNGKIEKRVHLTALKLLESRDYESLITYNCDKTPRSWKWNKIKDYFRELNIEEVALLNGDELNYHTEKDIPLFNACEDHDLQKIKQAVENGANVNAIDKYGETPISIVLDCVSDFDDDFLMKILDYLIEKGADINLFGFDGTDCLTNAHFSNKPKIMKYLFEHGARKDLNCFVTDLYDDGQWYIQNSAYNYCITDRAIGDYYDDNCQEQIDILEKNGVQFFIDGWDRKRLGWE